LTLNSSIVLKNHDCIFETLSVSLHFGGLGFKPCEWSCSPGQLEPGASHTIAVPFCERTDGTEISIVAEETIQAHVVVTADGQLVVEETRRLTILPPLMISANVAPVYSVAFQQNQFPLIENLELTNHSQESFEQIQVLAEFDPPEFEPATWNVDELSSGQSVGLTETHLRLSAGSLDRLNERRIVGLKFSAVVGGRTIASVEKEIELLPKNQWGGEMHMPELLAAFVTPNTAYCDTLLKKASNLLLKDGHESKLDGYQSNTRERPYMVCAALWSVISGEGVSYCVPPASFAKSGQKIRLGSDISTSRLATCLDTALLFAGCLEQAGLNSVIALTKGHAMAGAWLVDECFPLVTCDDPLDLRNRIALKDLILFETTLATSDQPIQFAQAVREADRKISEPFEADFVYVIDLKQARSRKIFPIDFGGNGGATQAEGTKKREVTLPPPPVLPPVDSQDKAAEELTPDGRVDQWRRKLLDLSKRNKLLNISQRSMGFKIICPDLDLLEDELAAGKKFSLLSKEEMVSDGRSTTQFTKQTGGNLETEFVRDQLRRGSLIADCSNRDLEKDLINLFRRAKSDMEEGGSNTLFLAIGMLRWKPDPRSDQSCRAPLILLPVKLERTSAKAKPKVRQLPDEGPVFNLTLIELLLQDFEIDLAEFQHDLPKDESGVDVRGIWNTVRSKIKETPGFEVVEELVLSNFSFAKYLMWKDLSDRLDDLKKSRFVNHLVETPTDPYPFSADFLDLREVDEKINPAAFFAPLNADSSQIVAIEASTKGKDLVLEGPPGTGKSETIANIIAHNMALERKVLFVSEKMAALEVVYSRLKKVGLGHLCLELHSNKASKKGVVEQLKEAWEVRESHSAGDWKERAQDLGTLRSGLNRYVEELHRKSHFGYSAHEAIARSVRRRETARIELGWAMNLETAPLRSEADVQNAKRIARDLGLAFRDAQGMNPESFALVTNPEWSNIWQAKLVDAANSLLPGLSDFRQQLDLLCQIFAAEFNVQPTIETVECWIKVARTCDESAQFSHRYILAENAKMRLDVLKEIAEIRSRFDALVSSSGVSVSPEEIGKFPVASWKEKIGQTGFPKEVFTAGESVLAEMARQGFHTEIESNHQQEMDRLMDQCDCSLPMENVVGLPVSDWIARRNLVAEKGALSRFFATRKIAKEMRVSGLKKTKELSVLDNYARLIDTAARAQKELMEQLIRQAAELVGLVEKLENLFAQFKDEGVFDLWNSTPEHLRERWEYGVATRRSFMDAANQLKEPGFFMAKVRKKLVDEREFVEGSELLKHACKLTELHDKAAEALAGFKVLAGASDIGKTSIQTVEERLEEIVRSAPGLNAWCHWIEAGIRAGKMGLSSLVRGMEQKLISWDEAEEQFETALCIWLAPLLIDTSDLLRNFSAGKHDDLIQRFRALDEHLAKTTGQYIAAKLASDMPETSGPNAPHEYGVLSREIQRQRGHKPVRQLIQELGGYLLDLTPCFMMSPLSVAQYLPSDFRAFDLVVFDEASQITVWDAVGAIARGKNVIVVGDPKQMPPTSFFNRAQDDGDSDEADLESILDQAMAARVGYHRLTGHYRSRHESLITFSNHQYYQNSLTTYPSADTRETAVTWHRVDGIYSKGAARNNPIEARAVVDEVVRRLKHPELRKLSIGIVTFNSEQQLLIENLLDDERRKDTSLERFFKEDSFEPVFVKNLETVQGDQRDVICLSVGYGPIEPGAQTMSMNFGPLNRQGGERRLNVAITRASTEMLVFSSFDAAMIDLSRTNAQAVRDLKAYIDYAARGPVALAQRTDFAPDKDQFDSEFEEAVAIRLREKGWALRTQIGVSKFRIDLGVIEPDCSGAFLAGVECDGASYHSSPSARDRDRVRHIILENLGWKLIRIWSTDFFVNPDNVIDRVHHQLEKLLEEKRANRKRQEEVVSGKEAYDSLEMEEDEFVEELEDESIPPAEEHVFVKIQSNSSTLPEQKNAPEEYALFSGKPLTDPRETDAETIAADLLEIVRIEGPMLAKRAYDTYLRCCGIKRMGKDIRSLMNRALQSAVNRNAVIKEDEWNSGGSLYSIIRLPEQDAVRLRTSGGRTIDEIPPGEIRAVADRILSESSLIRESEEHLREILNFYGLKRLTDHTREKIIQALELA
jgi:very-short-patch-repair endonuclease